MSYVVRQLLINYPTTATARYFHFILCILPTDEVSLIRVRDEKIGRVMSSSQVVTWFDLQLFDFSKITI